MKLNNVPDAFALWKGIGGYFDSLGEILCEFIDNSISNFRGNNCTAKSIVIFLEDMSDKVAVRVEDCGTGIKNLEAAFTLGCHDAAETPLNEHGFGFKHALASANPDNNAWTVETRTVDDKKKGIFKRISAPYCIGEQPVEEVAADWDGLNGNTGTIISFTCSKEMFKTIRRGLRGNFNFKSTIDILAENLGFIYSGVIKSDNISISIIERFANGMCDNPVIVKQIDPSWVNYCGPRQGIEDVDLGCGPVSIEYVFGRISDHASTKKYYKRSMSCSGAEIRINGRVLAYNLLKDIWQKEPHPSYNQFLATINVCSEHASRLPKTKTSKNDLRKGDCIIDNLFDWISKKLPAEQIPKNSDPESTDYDEREMFEKLAEAKKKHMLGSPVVSLEEKSYCTLEEKIRMDLCITVGQDVYVYEGKKDKTKLLDVYQLLMYWDGYVYDHPDTDRSLTQAILIAAEHPDSVRNVIPVINARKDSKGNNYNIILKTWRDEGIDYPV